MTFANLDDDENELLLADARLERRRKEIQAANLARARWRDSALFQKVNYREIIGESSPLAALLKITVKNAKKDRRAGRVDKIDEYAEAWRKITDDTVRAQTLKVAYNNGFITITVASPPLKNELENFLSAPLLALLRDELPQTLIRGLKFRCGATS